jgi:hypothetical protein
MSLRRDRLHGFFRALRSLERINEVGACACVMAMSGGAEVIRGIVVSLEE